MGDNENVFPNLLFEKSSSKAGLFKEKGKTLFRVGIDLMGGETSPEELFEAAKKAARRLKGASFTFFVDPAFSFFGKKLSSSTKWVEAGDSVSMEDHPLQVLRKKKNSSLLLGIKSLRDKEIDIFVTTSNTGALVGASRIFLKSPFRDLERPALLVVLPGEKKPFCLLDAGATLQYQGKDLAHLGEVGVIWHHYLFKSKTPKVALLNIGSESEKGRNEQKEAHQRLEILMKKGNFSFLGNLEPQHLFSSDADVIVTDGFSGNIFLKAFEGTVSFLLRLKEKTLLPLKKRLHEEALPFAILIGISGIVIKCHGSTSKEQFERTLHMLPDLFDQP